MPDLKTLISATYAQGVRYREMERLAKKAGYTVKFQTFQEYATGHPKSFPKSADTIRGMAVALGVTERAIVLAYAESLGIDTGRVDFADLVPLDANEMTEGMRNAVLAVIREATKGAHDASQESWTEKGSTSERKSTPAIAAQAEAERARINAELGVDVTTPVTNDQHRELSDGDGTTTKRKGAAKRGA